MNSRNHDNPEPRGRQLRSIRRAAGFTLIEAALTTVIIGTGVLAMVAAQQTYVQKSDWAQRTGNAAQLANELRELTMPLSMHDPITNDDTLGPEANELSVLDYDDLDDFAGVVDVMGVGAGLTFDPPINALRQPIANLPGWSQRINVVNVLPDNISSTFTQPVGSTPLMRATVTVLYQSPRAETPQTMTQLTWIMGE